MNQTTHTTGQSADTGTKFLAGVGVVALIVIVIWLGVQALQLGVGLTNNFAASLLSVRSLFGTSQTLALQVNPGVVSPQDTFVLSWTQDAHDETEGTYALVYECTPGVHLASPLSANTDHVIFCNTPFPIATEENELTLQAVSINEDPTNLPLRIEFTPTDSTDVTAEGETTVTVVHTAEQLAVIAGTGTSTQETTTDTTEPTTPTTPLAPQPPVTTIVTNTTPVDDPNGTPDLTVAILAVGTVSHAGSFTQKAEPLNPDERLAVRFVVENTGTKSSGPWRFEAELPTEPREHYRSPEQESLPPGARVEYILGFDQVEDDRARITIDITIDPDEDIDERNENNNDASISFDIKS